MTRTLTPAQIRIVRYVARKGSAAWVSLIELDHTRHLEEDDFAVVPSLVEAGWLEHSYEMAAVCMTQRGERLMDRLAGKRWTPSHDGPPSAVWD